MASELTDNQIAEIKDSFTLFDKDGDGTIDAKDLSILIRSLGGAPTESELKVLMDAVNPTGQGTLDFAECLEWIVQYLPDGHNEEEEIDDAFKVFDKEKNGLISSAEIKHALTNMGERLTNEEVDQLISEAHADGDGYIHYSAASLSSHFLPENEGGWINEAPLYTTTLGSEIPRICPNARKRLTDGLVQ